MNTLKITVDEMLNNNLECLYSDEHAEFYAKVGGTDTVRLTLDLDKGTIAIEIYLSDGEINTVLFNDLISAFSCLEVTHLFHTHIQDVLTNI